jgi:hypothetical protein
METKNLDVIYVARRHLAVGDDRIEPGQLVDITGWTEKIVRIHVEQGLMAPMLVTEGSRAEITAQWEAEEQARAERRQEAPEPPPPPPPEPPPPLARRVWCWNCLAPHDFAEDPADDDRFQCAVCDQVQLVAEAKPTSGYGRHGAD